MGPNGTGAGTASQSINILGSGTYTFSFWDSGVFGATFSLTATVGPTTVFNANVTNDTYVQQSTTVNLATGVNNVQFSGAWISGTNDSALFIDDVSLSLLNPLPPSLAAMLPPSAPVNVVNVANSVDSFTGNGGTLPVGFQNLFNLTPQQLQAALSQLSGETATDSEKGAFQLMMEFLNVMLDPLVVGRGGMGGGAIGFAPERQESFPPDIALAYAGVLKVPPKPAAFDQRWTAWGSGFGGSSTTNGNAAAGTNDVTASTYGGVAGLDYHFTPDSVAGFALAGAGTNWNLAQGLGGGQSEAFQVGLYGKTQAGPAYLAAALAFGNHWMTTNRFAALGDQLTARFDAQSYGGRIEGGYRFGTPVLGAAPYAAIQVQSFHTPTYSETDLSGLGFGLTYNSMSATDTRSELGARFDDLTAVGAMPLVLRARLAWAHDWVSNPALGAVFQALPGSSFTVDGAAPPQDSALASAGAELHITPALALLAKFDGEFANGSQTYAGTATLRYAW